MHSKFSWLVLGPRNTLTPSVAVETNKESTAAYCLSKLPGKVLELSALLANKKFRGRGNKEGALAAFHQLQGVGLGKLSTTSATRGASSVSVH